MVSEPATAVSIPPGANGARMRRDKGGVPFLVRACLPGDLESLQRFYESFEPKRVAQGLPPSSPDRMRKWLRSVLETGIHLVAVREGVGLIGHAFVVPTGRPGVGEYAVFLHQDLRGRGVGTELNRAAVEEARAAGMKRLWLSVEPRNWAAIRSYEKVGFEFVPQTVFSIEPEMEMGL